MITRLAGVFTGQSSYLKLTIKAGIITLLMKMNSA